MHPQIDEFIRNAPKWRQELELLRMIVLDCQLTESFKWRQPCYGFNGGNVLILSGFKEYCALNFFKGSLLQDTHGILVKPGENTRGGRQIRFTNVREIVELEPVLKAYIFEAIEVERAGLDVAKQTAPPAMPPELLQELDASAMLKTAFEALTPGRQRAYIMHFAAPKQSKTRSARIAKFIPRILSGKGISDCTCGLTHKPPGCDGSHKYA